VHTRSTAGQASIEYIAAVALIAAIFVLAAPAVGAPPLGKQVVHGIRRGICLVAGDVCSNADAKAAGLAPCPLSSDTKGHEFLFSALIYEVGGKETVTVTPQSDGTFSVVRVQAKSKGVTGGIGPELHAGPISFDIGPNGSIRERVQEASGWIFPDRASALRFVASSLVKSPQPAWVSGEKTLEAQGGVGLQAGAKNFADRLGLLSVSASAGGVMGSRVSLDGSLTFYLRAEWAWADASVPVLPSVGPGSHARTIELTVDRDGPRELAFRDATPEHGGNVVVDTVERLNLRDPFNRAAAGPLLDAREPLQHLADVVRKLHDRIPEHGTIERSVSAVHDSSGGISGSLRGGAKLAGSYKHIKIHKQLVSATARVEGAERERFDCVGGQS
jgi:hypothetical protein